MFTDNQLDFIKRIARDKRNQGELSVAKAAGYNPENFTREELDIVYYCAGECRRQRSGEMSVYDMLVAWEYAMTIHNHQPNTLDTSLIQVIGKLVEPIDNKSGFRKVPIFVGNGTFGYNEKAPWDRVPTLLEMLLDSYYLGLLNTEALDAENGDPHYAGWNKLSKSAEDQFYFEYENIHPFKDGNGRSGKIILNYLKGTLDKPVMPPNYWNIENP